MRQEERRGEERRGEERSVYVSELECRRNRHEQMGGQLSCSDKAKNEELLSCVTLSQPASEEV